MALGKKVLLLIGILASLIVATSCATNPVIPTPNYYPSEAIKEKLQEAAKAFGRDLPIPTYLPQGYAITDAKFLQQQYTNDQVELTLAGSNTLDINMSITWFRGTFHLKPSSERYKYLDISGGPGTYGSVVLNYLSDRNTLWWDWTPVTTFSENETPSQSPYYEMVLSASKDVPGEELVNIAKFVRLP